MIYVRCTSHRARHKLERLLGYPPRDFFTLPNYTHYLEIPAEYVDAALAIKGVFVGKPRGDLLLAWT